MKLPQEYHSVAGIEIQPAPAGLIDLLGCLVVGLLVCGWVRLAEEWRAVTR